MGVHLAHARPGCMKHDPRARCSQRSLRVCVVARVFLILSITLRTPHQNTQGKRTKAQTAKHTHGPRPDPARNHPSRPRPRQTPSHPTQPKRKPHPHNTPHHNPPHQTHKQKNQKKHKTGTRGNRGEAKERKEERRRKKEEEKGEGEKHKTGTRGNRTPDLLHPKKESYH